MSKEVYMYGSDTTFNGYKIVDDNYELQMGETLVPLPNGIKMPAKFNGSTWTEATDAEYKAYLEQQKQAYLAQNPEASQPTKPSTQDQAMNALGLQVADLVKENQDLKKSINALGLQVAQAMATNKDTTATTDTEKEGN